MLGVWLIKKDFPDLADGLASLDKHSSRAGKRDYQFTEGMGMRPRMPIRPGMPAANLNITGSTRSLNVNSRQIHQLSPLPFPVFTANVKTGIRALSRILWVQSRGSIGLEAGKARWQRLLYGVY